MRAIVALGIIALLMALAGWVTFRHSGDETTITIETEEIQRDTENAIQGAERIIDSGARAISSDDANIDSNASGEPSHRH